MMGPGDAVRAGLVATLARPGGNVTGLTQMTPEMTAKRLQLLVETVPGLTRIAILFNPGNPNGLFVMEEARTAAKTLGLAVHGLEIRTPGDVDAALSAVAANRPDAIVLLSDSMIHSRSTSIAEFAIKHRLPTISPYRQFAKAGGLMIYGVDIPDIFRRAVDYIDKILKGAEPADLPVRQPTKFELVINLRTARTLGITLPRSLLVQASELIE
jgi:putative ABC transport system substrate-binding protein